MKLLNPSYYVPPRIMTNEYLAKFIPGVDPVWTEEVLGIKERRIGNESLADMAFKVSSATLDNSINPNALIVATSTSEVPPVASQVQNRLLTNCPAFDINSVCAGFLTALVMAHYLPYETTLLVGVDAFSYFTNWTNRDSVFFGDGAGAVVYSKTGNGKWLGEELYGLADTRDAFTVDSFWKMDKREVFSVATTVLPDAINRVLQKANISQVDHIVPHQASLNIIKTIAAKTGLPLEKFRMTLDTYANTAAASIPITLAKSNIKDGETVLLFSIGAGWNYGVVVLQW